MKEAYLDLIYTFHTGKLSVNWVFSIFGQEEDGLNYWSLQGKGMVGLKETIFIIHIVKKKNCLW